MSTITARRRTSSLSNSGPTTLITANTDAKANIATQNRYGILADCLLDEEKADYPAKTTPRTSKTTTNTTEHEKIKPPPIYIHHAIHHAIQITLSSWKQSIPNTVVNSMLNLPQGNSRSISITLATTKTSKSSTVKVMSSTTLTQSPQKKSSP